MPTESPNFSKADWKSYRHLVNQKMSTAPEITKNTDSIDAAVKFISQTIMETDKEAIPRRRPRNASHKIVPQHVLTIIKKKQAIRKLLKKTRNKDLKRLINQLDKAIKREMKAYELEVAQSKWERANDKSEYGFFKLARKILTPGMTSTTPYPLVDSNGNKLKDDQEKAEAFRELYLDIRYL